MRYGILAFSESLRNPQEINSWAINRINRLKEAGWGKAMLA
jgi:hypothetical protein